MDPEVAAELVRKGATLLLLDVPQRTLLGIDTQVGLPPSRNPISLAAGAAHGSLSSRASENSDDDSECLQYPPSVCYFQMGQSLEAFMQWKSLVILLFSCSEAPLHTRTNMFVKFIRAIYYQFSHGFQHIHDSRSGEDMGNSLFLDEAWFSRDIFLYRLSKTRKLKSLLETTFGWDLENNVVSIIDEDDEFAPVVVEMDGS
ncbi:hypothetical protein GUJ93_ZPchr0004g39652 [Zizania palustris]|uniref:AAR2 C-terminal domain-containing protein n=1 Tax=Zizania palustris TaxID=103762 RepID=A0A8J5VF13_ZIZPA|nr:hypothetical protein GUJ93_ZPchr0004g39652 [Zizania palustris]